MSVLKNGSDIIPIKHNWDSGNGLKFDGVDDYVSLGTVLNFNKDSAFSIMIIFSKPAFDLVNAERIISKVGDPDTYDTGYFIYTVVGSNIIFFLNTSITNRISINSNQSILSNTVYNVIITKNTDTTANSLNMYINGVLLTSAIKTTTGTLGLTTNSNPFTIGAFKNSTSILYNNNIIMYDTKIFNKELTQAEATELYIKQGQIVPSTAISSLQLDMRFNDKQGTVAIDKSTNGYNGTLTNFTNTALGVSNAWVDKYGNPITTL